MKRLWIVLDEKSSKQKVNSFNSSQKEKKSTRQREKKEWEKK